MRCHTFVYTPRVNRAVSIISAPKKLASLSITQLISLKADLFNYSDMSMDELFDAFNSPKRLRIKEYNDMGYKEQKIFTALEDLNAHARQRMKKIARDFKSGKKTEDYTDIHNLSFAFRNNGYNYKSYPEVTLMNSEVSWYKHVKASNRFKRRLSKMMLKNAVAKIKSRLQKVGDWVGNILFDEEKNYRAVKSRQGHGM